MGVIGGVLPAYVILSAQRNGCLRREFVFSDDDGALDFAGYSAQMQLRPSIGSDTVNLTVTSSAPTAGGSEITFTDPVNGTLELYLSQSDLQSLPVPTTTGAAGQFVYDLVLTEPGGDATPWLYGSIIIAEGVTW